MTVNSIREPERDLPVRGEFDVVVLGGGPAGIAAAASAAAQGRKTLLVERYGFLGGMATAGMVSTICGLYHSSPSGAPEPINEGFAESFARRLVAMPGCQKPVRRGRSFVLPYTPFAFACLADDLVAAVTQLDVYLHAYLVGVEAGPSRIDALRIARSRRWPARAGHRATVSGPCDLARQ